MTKFDDQSKYYQSYLNIGIVWVTLVLIMFFLTSCYVYESSYVAPEQEHPTEVYYHNDLPYWGFYNNYYYYYGKPHLYPWWYYYTIIPHYTYNIHTHVTIYCNTGYYVSRPRGPKFNNNRGGTYKPNNTVVVKSNRTNIRTNKNTINIKTNTNRVNVKTNKSNVKTNRSNTNKSNVKINRNNINKNNIKINRSNTNRTNINKSKNTNRNNRSNNRKPR